MNQLILASSSARRIEMIESIQIKFKIVKPNIIEKRKINESPTQYVQRLSLEKALAAYKLTPTAKAVLAADTIVVYKNKVLEKPKSRNDAFKMLKSLSGKKHKVTTGWCWLINDKQKRITKSYFQTTEVVFAKRPDSFWKWYSQTNEPLDKAGAYAAQGIGLSFIDKLNGSYSNVVGLPLSKVIDTFEMLSKKDFYDYFR